MTEKEWFQWERQATVHPIIMCMEDWAEPMKKEYSRPWPTTVLIYNNDLVGWYNKWDGLLDYGQYLIDKFINKQNKLELKIRKLAKGLDGYFDQLEETNLRNLDDEKLLQTYKKFREKWALWFVPGGLVEPIGHQGEKILEKKLAGKADVATIISLITTTNRESFSKRELRELLGIFTAKKSGQNIDSKLEIHAKKYRWLHNNYFTTEILDSQFFLNELKLLEEKYPDPQKQILEMEKEQSRIEAEKQKVIKELGFGQEELALVELLDFFAWYQDYRKEYIMKLLHYLDLILAEIGARRRVPLKEMKYSLPSEISEILANNFDRNKLKERMRRFLYYWDAENGKVEFGGGQFSIDLEKKIFHSIRHEDEVVEVSGMVANKGIVRGKARITMSAKEAANIQKGEILITSMTTPDFITAMKRAAAVVTNEGGVLCHAAIVSRELGVPCIVGTRIATKVFKTGDLIEVDGNLGVVRKVE
jgi:phosphohistidine swiveling domain-containing protein